MTYDDFARLTSSADFGEGIGFRVENGFSYTYSHRDVKMVFLIATSVYGDDDIVNHVVELLTNISLDKNSGVLIRGVLTPQ